MHLAESTALFQNNNGFKGYWKDEGKAMHLQIAGAAKASLIFFTPYARELRLTNIADRSGKAVRHSLSRAKTATQD
jgi:hypothetical protein